MRKASGTGERSRSISAGSRIPLSLIAKTLLGMLGSRCSLTARSVSKVRRIAVVDADERRAKFQSAHEFARVVHLDEHVEIVCTCLVHALRQRGVIETRDDAAECRPPRKQPIARRRTRTAQESPSRRIGLDVCARTASRNPSSPRK